MAAETGVDKAGCGVGEEAKPSQGGFAFEPGGDICR